MRNYLIAVITCFLFLSSNIFALHRDYKSDHYYSHCLIHLWPCLSNWLPPDLINYIPPTDEPCSKIICNNDAIYLGYVDTDHQKYRDHLTHQLKYSSQNTSCSCYWPECSLAAAKISNSAYLLFRDLLLTTPLSNLLDENNPNDQKEFMKIFISREFESREYEPFNEHGITVLFIAQQFKFSDYYHLCKDIEDQVRARYNEKDLAEIKDRLEDILEALYCKFFPLYTACFAQHPHPDIEQEIKFMKLLVGDISGLDKKQTSFSNAIENYTKQSYDLSELIIGNLRTAEIPVKSKNKKLPIKNNVQSFLESVEYSISSTIGKNTHTILRNSVQSKILLEQGSILNDLLLYKGAIEALTEAIKLNPSNRDAYIERATAYFDTNQFSLSLKDYEQAKKLTVIPPFKTDSQYAVRMLAIYIPENKIDFSRGLVSGMFEGANVSVKEFLPSIFNCCRGILNGLWSFVLSPEEVSQEMINAVYAIGEYTASHSTAECLECMVPELQELSLMWHKINDHVRGRKIGYIIGKYGVDVFAPMGILKGAHKIRALKRANTMCTLEGCAVSEVK